MKRKLSTLLIVAGLSLPATLSADHVWVGVFAKNTPFKTQGFESRKYFTGFAEAIKARWKQGYTLYDLEQGYHRWMGIFVKGGNYTSQAFTSRVILRSS